MSRAAVGTAAGALVSLDDIRAAAERLTGIVVRTPLLHSFELSEEVGGDVRLKCESLQRIGAFKARGANNFLLQLSEAELARGVITYSSGNHAQAVALAAGLRRVKAVVVMPTTAPAVKRVGAERLGAQVILEGTTSQERKVKAEAIAAADGLVMVPPFDDPWIIAGQGTVGLEIAEGWPKVEVVLVPVGGGGLASGVAAAIRRMKPHAKVIGVEPTGAASMRAALDAGRPVTLKSVDTIADGLAPTRTGDLTFRHMRELADDVVTVHDAAIKEAARFLLHRQKLVVEFSGAAAVAALRSGRVEVKGKNVVAVLSGGNLDPSLMTELAG